MQVKRSLFLVGAVLFPLLIGAVTPKFSQHFRSAATTVIGPLLQLQHDVLLFSKKQIGYLLEWPKLREENDSLKAEVEQLKSELLNLDETKHKIDRLESLLKLKQNFVKQGIAARVIARDPSHWTQFIVINKGSRDGVRKNTVLINADGLIGKVTVAGAHSARAILITDSEARASALDQRTRDVGLIEGTGALLLKMIFLDRQSKIQVGDMIITSGLGGIYPKGIPIGRVELVGSEKNNLNLYAVIKPYASFSKLEEVLCIPSQTSV